MPITILAVVVIAALAAGGFFISRDTTTEIAVVVPEIAVEEGIVDTMPSIEPVEETDPAVSQMTDTEIPTTNNVAAFTDGTYETMASYFTPRNVEHEILVSVTLSNNVITEATVLYDGKAAETPSHIRFEEAWQSEVIGLPIDEVALSRTGGASLTSDAFNEAVDTIKQDASV